MKTSIDLYADFTKCFHTLPKFQVYGTRNKKIQYSGPLMPPGGNVEDMLKEHERQIQQAVRKARIDKVKTKKNF